MNAKFAALKNFCQSHPTAIVIGATAVLCAAVAAQAVRTQNSDQTDEFPNIDDLQTPSE